MRSSSFFKKAPLDDLRVLRKSAVLAIVGLSATSIQRLEAAGDFPARVVLSDNAVGWLEGDIRSWLKARDARAAVRPLGARAVAKKSRGARE